MKVCFGKILYGCGWLENPWLWKLYVNKTCDWESKQNFITGIISKFN